MNESICTKPPDSSTIDRSRRRSKNDRRSAMFVDEIHTESLIDLLINSFRIVCSSNVHIQRAYSRIVLKASRHCLHRSTCDKSFFLIEILC